MPTLNVFVTTPREEIPPNFLPEASKLISNLLGKPESYVTVRVVPDQLMCHGGTLEPCGSVQLMSLGALGEKNPFYAKEIGNFMESQLKIKKDRFYITFCDIDRNDCGYNGTTFAAM